MAIPILQPRVPIAQLRPDLESADQSSVHGIVTLVWPYNSLTKSLSLLLVEPDFRLRRQQGQVRIQFFGSSAKAVTKAGISGGDELALSLQGSSWEKDIETANTPGRGIAWKVIFGERVVLETRHPGEASRVLDIDHPPPSPELSLKASSPPSSPLYNSHIPTSSVVPNIAITNDEYTTWSSPAFLKRSHFATSIYDPFAELDDDFVDNDRKKRAKFGRGSGQWKFVGNVPSPERDRDNFADQESLSSSSKVLQQDTQQEGKMQANLATPPPEAIASRINGEYSFLVAPESAPLNDEISSDPAEPANLGAVNAYDHGAKWGPSLNDGLPPNYTGRPVEFEREVDQTGHSPGIVEQNPVSSSPQTSLRRASPSVGSVIDPSSTSNPDNSENELSIRDNSSDVIRSESVYGFGMDGTALSRVHQVANIAPMASEIGRRWIEMQRQTGKSDSTESTTQVSESELSTNLRSEVSFEISCVPQEPLDRGEAFVQPVSGASMPDSNQSFEATEMPKNQSSDVKDDSENVSLDQVRKHDTDEISLVQSTEPEDSEGTKPHLFVQLRDWTSLDDKDKATAHTMVTKTTGARAAMEKGPSSQENLSPVTNQDLGSSDERFFKPSLETQVTNAELRNDEEHNEDHIAPDSARDTLKSPFATVFDDQKVFPRGSIDDIAEQDSATQKAPVARESRSPSQDNNRKRLNDTLNRGRALANSTQTDVPLIREKSDGTSDIELPIGSSEISESPSRLNILQESISNVVSDDDMTNTKMQPKSISQASITNAENLLPQSQMPSTIQDTLENSYASQPMTADDIEEPARSYDVHRSIINAPDLTESNRADDLESQITASNHAPSQTSVAQQSWKNSASNRSENGEDSSMQSSLITRLKELRRRSDRTAGEHLSSNSASPWFAPRRPNLVTNGEAETTALPSPTEQLKMTTIKTPTNTTLEKTDLRLSQSFIRSSPPQSPQPQSQSSLQQESQHVLNSQRTTGFRTNLSYFVPVTSLHCHYGTSVDVLAMAISSTSVTRATSGPKDHNQKIYLTDPSSTISKDPTLLTTAQIFRPYRTKREFIGCFPEIQTGDAILLRDFKVQSFQKHLSLISTDSSAWAVFRKDADVQINGPPVEYGPEERAFAHALWNWWSSLDAAESAALVAAVPKPKSSGAKSISAKKGLGFELPSSQSKNVTKKTESSNNRIPDTLQAQTLDAGLKSFPEPNDNEAEASKLAPQRRILRPRKAKGQASIGPEKDALPRVEEVHELRDGTRYVDREGVGPGDVDIVNGVHDLRNGTRYRDRLRK